MKNMILFYANWFKKKKNKTFSETLEDVLFTMGPMSISLALGRKKWEDGEKVVAFETIISTEGYDSLAEAVKEGLVEIRKDIDDHIWTQIDKSIPLNKHKITVSAPLSIKDLGDGHHLLYTELGVVVEEEENDK